jgi:tetratricopeptide (TPR) repeat protein
MLGCTRLLASACLVLVGTAVARGQLPSFDDPPRPYKGKPADAAAMRRREALKRYADGLLCLREDRLLEALRAFEESARLDPSAPATYKAQVPLLLALDRGPAALAACRKVVELDPDDYEGWAILGRMHKARGHDKEARAALETGLKVGRLHDHPEMAQQMYFELGALCESAGAFAAAADAFHRAADLLDHPDLIAEHSGVQRQAVLAKASETYERIGTLYRKAKDYDRAVAAYVKAQERAPARAGRLNFNLAELCKERGDDRKALEYVDAYLRLQPMGTEAYELRIALLKALKREADILPWLETTAGRDEHNVALHLLYARELGRAGQTEKAEKAYLALAHAAPSVELYRALFRLYQQDRFAGPPRVLERLDAAIGRAAAPDGGGAGAAQAQAMVGALRDDAALARDVVKVAFRGGDETGLKFDTLQLLAVLADKHRLNDEAEKFYRQCLPRATRSNEARIYGGLLRVLSRSRMYEEIIRVCQDGLRRSQATNQLLFLTDMARAQAALDRFDEALRSCDRAYNLAGDDNKLYVRHLRVRVLIMAERHADAENECLALMKQYTQPGDVAEIRYLLSSVYTATKQPARAEEQLHLILKADPNNATANNDLGYQWAEQNKNLDEAEAMIRRAIDLDRRQRQTSKNPATSDEDNAAYVDSLGWVLFRRGRLDEAKKELERATKLPDGQDPTIWDHLGDVYFRLEMTAEARECWEHALELFEQGRRRHDDRRRDVQRKLETFKAAGGR